MKLPSGSKIMVAGILIILVLGWLALRGYTLYTSCVRERVNEVDMKYLTLGSSLNSSEYQIAVERAILGCSTNGMEIAGAGVFFGLVIFVAGITKIFLDKKPVVTSQTTSNQIIVQGNASESNIVIGSENDATVSSREGERKK